MKALEEKISAEGKVLSDEVLKVGSFLNQQIDAGFMMEMGAEIARLFSQDAITRVLTIEASGIALGLAAACALHVPLVFAKKSASSNLSGEDYTAQVHSFTHDCDFIARVPQAYLTAEDTVLIVDDFLAQGNAVEGLSSIVEQAGARLAGVAIAVEKGFQGGGDRLRARGVHLESLAVIDSMSPDGIIYR